MRRTIVSILSLVVILTGMGSVDVHGATYREVADEAIKICEAFELVVGTGNGLTPEYLASTPKRYGGAKLIVALNGYLDRALNYPFVENFSDHMDLGWIQGRNILGYLKEHPQLGYQGYPDGTFRPNADMSVKEYYKLMLVSLGYREDKDFSWNGGDDMPDVMEMTSSVGLVWLEEGEPFTMEKLCVATLEALGSNRKDSESTLADFLVERGAIDSVLAEAFGLLSDTDDPDPVEPDPLKPELTVSAYQNDEVAMVNGETVLVLEISEGSFKKVVGGNNLLTQALIDGISGTVDSTAAFKEVVLISSDDVTRLSDTVIMIDMPVSEDYRIAGDGELTVTLDPSVFGVVIEAPLGGKVSIADSGSGLEEDPWRLTRPDDLKMMEYDSDAHFVLMQDLDFEEAVVNPVEGFTGKLDGGGYTIRNMKISGGDRIGLFDRITEVTVSDLGFENISVAGQGDDGSFRYAGVLAGDASNSVITEIRMTDCSVAGAKYTGGLFGIASGRMEITGCKLDGVSIKDTAFGGSMIGFSSQSQGQEIEECTVTHGTVEAYESAGGLVGQVFSGLSVVNSSYSGEVKSSMVSLLSYPATVGGLVGRNTGNLYIDSSRNSGTVSAGSGKAVGGILGYNEGFCELTNNYGAAVNYLVQSELDMMGYDISGFHRVLGRDDGQSLLNNTGYTHAKVMAGESGENLAEWQNDSSDLDGADFSWMILE